MLQFIDRITDAAQLLWIVQRRFRNTQDERIILLPASDANRIVVTQHRGRMPELEDKKSVTPQMLMHAAEDLLKSVIRADISDCVEETVSSIKRSAPNLELRHVLQLKLNLRICHRRLLLRTLDHIR